MTSQPISIGYFSPHLPQLIWVRILGYPHHWQAGVQCESLAANKFAFPLLLSTYWILRMELERLAIIITYKYNLYISRPLKQNDITSSICSYRRCETLRYWREWDKSDQESLYHVSVDGNLSTPNTTQHNMVGYQGNYLLVICNHLANIYPDLGQQYARV